MARVEKGLRTLVTLQILNALGALRRQLIGPHAVAVLARAENGSLLVPAGDMFVGRRLCFNGSYDREDIEALMGACDSESKVLVVGAHVGSVAIPLAKRVRSVDAVEANPATFELLRINVTLNDLRNMNVHNLAAGDCSEEVSMLASRLNTGGSKLKMGDWNRWVYVYDKPQTVSVRMQRLDEVFPGRRFDLIVMDIEGSETRALRGMQKLLEACPAVMVEIVDHHLRRIAKVSNDEFLSLLAPHFDEVVVLPGASGNAELACLKKYQEAGFQEMMSECCRRGSANVLFRKSLHFHPGAPTPTKGDF